MDDKINLKVIQKYDPYCIEILDKSGRTALYLFNPKDNEWNKTKTEGVFFFYKRTLVPFYAFMILNVKVSANQIEYITKDLQLQLQLPFLLYKNQHGNIHSVWFYSEEDCSRIAARIGKHVHEAGGNDLKIGARKPPPSGNTPTRDFPETNFNVAAKGDLLSSNSPDMKFGNANSISSMGGLDLISMLTKAKQEHRSKPNGDQLKQFYSLAAKPGNSRSIDLKDLFASSNQIQSVTSPSQSSRNATVLIQGSPIAISSVNPTKNLPQPATRTVTVATSVIKDSSHDGAGMTLEQLERMLVSQEESYSPNVQASIKNHVTPNKITPSDHHVLFNQEISTEYSEDEVTLDRKTATLNTTLESRAPSSMSQIFKSVMWDSTRLKNNYPNQGVCASQAAISSNEILRRAQFNRKTISNNKEALLDLLDKMHQIAQNVPSLNKSLKNEKDEEEEDDDNEILTPSMMASRLEKSAAEEPGMKYNQSAASTTTDSIASSSLSGHLISEPHTENETLVTRLAKSNKSKATSDGLHLTKEQLKESLIFLLQDDEAFLNKIHAAYLQTLDRRLNHQ